MSLKIISDTAPACHLDFRPDGCKDVQNNMEASLELYILQYERRSYYGKDISC